jgi:hypothetical protein
MVVLVVACFTRTQPVIHDALWYVGMATDGVFGNEHLAAPYVYRLAVPMIVGALSKLFALQVERGFQLLVWISAIALLLTVFLFALRRNAGVWRGVVILSLCGFSFYHVKYPLAAYAMVDVEAYPLILLATWSLLERRVGLCVAISSLGLLFKEFLIIPLAVQFLVLLTEYRKDRASRHLVWAITIVGSFALLFVLPRMLIPVQAVYGNNLEWRLQNSDALKYLRNLPVLLSNPFDGARIFNILFASASYWLPALLLVTGDRLRDTWNSLAGQRSIILGFLVMLIAMTLIGGTNIMIFVTYGVPMLVLVLACFLGTGTPLHEGVLVLAAVVVYNRVWVPIPSFAGHFEQAIDLYGGWGSRINEATLYRVVEMAGYILLAVVLRRASRWWRSRRQA